MGQWDGIDEFVAVAETASFTQAAVRLRTSSSNISRRIARLEDRLAARLFYRTTRRVSLTEAGRTLYAQCQRLVEDRDEAFHSISDLQDAPVGLVRMTCAIAYGERYVMPLVNGFLEQNPRLRVEMQLTNVALDLVQEGIDLAIRLGRLEPSGLVVTRLAPRRLYLCATPAYLARHGAPHSLSEVAGHSCLIGTSDIWVFRDGGQDRPLKVDGRLRCNSGEAVLDAALRGFGLCQLPDYYVQDHLKAGRLVSLLEAHQPPDTAVWAVSPQRRHLAPKVRLMVAHLRAGLAAVSGR